MVHCVPHCPLAQTWPLPQLAPSATLLQADVLFAG
jgi:hypothetical protein